MANLTVTKIIEVEEDNPARKLKKGDSLVYLSDGRVRMYRFVPEEQEGLAAALLRRLPKLPDDDPESRDLEEIEAAIEEYRQRQN
jgi:hypothetical protein